MLFVQKAWAVAQGAAAAAAGIVLSNFWLFDTQFWLQTEPQGATIYPGLPALPQATPGPDPAEFLRYVGLMQAATVAGALALLSGLLAGVLWLRLPPAGRPQLRLWWLLLLVPLLIPMVVQRGH